MWLLYKCAKPSLESGSTSLDFCLDHFGIFFCLITWIAVSMCKCWQFCSCVYFSAKCIDHYTRLRVENADLSDDEQKNIDPRLEVVVNRMFQRCLDDKQFKQVRAWLVNCPVLQCVCYCVCKKICEDLFILKLKKKERKITAAVYFVMLCLSRIDGSPQSINLWGQNPSKLNNRDRQCVCAK